MHQPPPTLHTKLLDFDALVPYLHKHYPTSKKRFLNTKRRLKLSIRQPLYDSIFAENKNVSVEGIDSLEVSNVSSVSSLQINNSIQDIFKSTIQDPVVFKDKIHQSPFSQQISNIFSSKKQNPPKADQSISEFKLHSSLQFSICNSPSQQHPHPQPNQNELQFSNQKQIEQDLSQQLKNGMTPKKSRLQNLNNSIFKESSPLKKNSNQEVDQSPEKAHLVYQINIERQIDESTPLIQNVIQQPLNKSLNFQNKCVRQHNLEHDAQVYLNKDASLSLNQSKGKFSIFHNSPIIPILRAPQKKKTEVNEKPQKNVKDKPLKKSNRNKNSKLDRHPSKKQGDKKQGKKLGKNSEPEQTPSITCCKPVRMSAKRTTLPPLERNQQQPQEESVIVCGVKKKVCLDKSHITINSQSTNQQPNYLQLQKDATSSDLSLSQSLISKSKVENFMSDDPIPLSSKANQILQQRSWEEMANFQTLKSDGQLEFDPPPFRTRDKVITLVWDVKQRKIQKKLNEQVIRMIEDMLE